MAIEPQIGRGVRSESALERREQRPDGGQLLVDLGEGSRRPERTGEVRPSELGVARGGGIRRRHSIFDVVEGLVGEAPAARQLGEQPATGGRGAGDHRRQLQRQPQQRHGLARHHARAALSREPGALEVEIPGLAVENAGQPEALFEQGRGRPPRPRPGTGQGSPDQRVAAMNEAERGEQCRRLAVHSVDAGAAPARDGVVHRRQVVEQQGSGVERLDPQRQIERDARGEAVDAPGRPGQLRAPERTRRGERVAHRAGQVALRSAR